MAIAILQTLECFDILVKIFLHLTPHDVVSAGLTCKLWHTASADPSLWRHFCLQRWPSLSHPSARLCLSLIRNFHRFFTQRESKKVVDPEADRWLFFVDDSTILIDVFLLDRPIFSTAIAGSAVVKERLRFKLPPNLLCEITTSSSSSSSSSSYVDLNVRRPSQDLHAIPTVTSPSPSSAVSGYDNLNTPRPNQNLLDSSAATSGQHSSSYSLSSSSGYGDLNISRTFRGLHVQLSIVRHSDGMSACLVNGFPAPSSAKQKQRSPSQGQSSRYGLKCVLLLIDNHAFLNFYW